MPYVQIRPKNNFEKNRQGFAREIADSLRISGHIWHKGHPLEEEISRQKDENVASGIADAGVIVPEISMPIWSIDAAINGDDHYIFSGDWLVGTIATALPKIEANLAQSPLEPPAAPAESLRAEAQEHVGEALDVSATKPAVARARRILLNVEKLGQLDTSGAHFILRLIGEHESIAFIGTHAVAKRLFSELAPYTHDTVPTPIAEKDPVADGLAKIGEGLVEFWKETLATLSFLGEVIMALIDAAKNPRKLRMIPIFAVMESAGVNAMPIVMVLTFFIGAVVAYMGASTLQQFGAQIFTIDLLGVSILREFAVLITAIILAGRSDSAFTAQIGAMKMNQEIDAMVTMGIKPIEMLVVPRVIALIVMTPILTLAAMLAGLLGGAAVIIFQLGVSPTLFLARLQENVGLVHFWTGMAKTPFFAFVMAIIGCRQGLSVGNDVISLGKNTTAAVVQAIFMVIVLDAIFAMVYMELDL